MAAFVQKTLPKYYSTSRELRNEAEKQRRNKLNHHVSELAALIPYVSKAQKKVDKTSILRLAASYLRLHNVLNHSQQTLTNFPLTLKGDDALRNLFNSIGGFLLVITSSGKVVYVSEAIEDTFGYTQSDILGRCFYNLIHQDDVQLLQHQLQPKESPRRSFYCRLLEKSLSRNDKPKYEIIHVMGHLKPYSFSSHGEQGLDDPGPSSRPPIRRRRRRYSQKSTSDHDDDTDRDSCSSTASPGEDVENRISELSDSHILVSFVEIVRDRPITELLWVESMRDEYITRHRTDASIAYVDHRISFVTGLMPEEVVGSSAFEHMHREDVLWSIVAQKQMLMSSEGQGTITYRLRCRNGTHVSLRSRGFLEVNKDTGKVDTFICINTLLSDKEGEEETIEQRKRLLPLMNFESQEELSECVGSGLPTEIRKMIRRLINPQTCQMMQNFLKPEPEFQEEFDPYLEVPHTEMELSPAEIEVGLENPLATATDFCCSGEPSTAMGLTDTWRKRRSRQSCGSSKFRKKEFADELFPDEVEIPSASIVEIPDDAPNVDSYLDCSLTHLPPQGEESVAEELKVSDFFLPTNVWVKNEIETKESLPSNLRGMASESHWNYSNNHLTSQ